MVLGVKAPVSDAVWWPSPFGADDELGMLNHVDDAKRRQAMAHVRPGKTGTGSSISRASSTRRFRSSPGATSARRS